MHKKELDFDLKFILNLVMKHWLLILSVAVIGLIVAFCYNKLATPLYHSNISMFTWNTGIDEAIKSIKNSGNVSDNKNGDNKNRRHNSKLQQVMMYNSVVSQSLRLGNTLLRDYQRMLNSREVRTATNLILAKRGFKPPFKYTIKCSTKKQSCIMDMTVTSSDPRLAEAAANNLISELTKEQERLMKITYTRAIGPASLPTTPFSPRKKLNLLIGLALGALLGGLIAFLIDYLDMNVKTPEDLKNAKLLPLGIIPIMPAIGSLYKPTDYTKTSRHDNTILDAVRLINTTISYLRIDNPPRVIAFSSVLQQAGKSTSSLLLAKVMGASDKKVLVIDCDLRKPQIYKNTSLSASPGLVDYLADIKTDDSIPYINKNFLPNVDIMTHGVIPPTPTELLGSQRFQDMIKNLKTSYDTILLDCPPSTGMADAMVLAHSFDAMILVIESDKTRIHQLNQILEQLDAVRDKIIGGILNKVNYKKHGSYYYNSSYYYAAYAEDKPQKS
jgi:capsular exopolysaccharide synthesis family protein